MTMETPVTIIDPRRPEYRDGYKCGYASFKHDSPYQPGPHRTLAEKHFATGYGDGWFTAADGAENDRLAAATAPKAAQP